MSLAQKKSRGRPSTRGLRDEVTLDAQVEVPVTQQDGDATETEMRGTTVPACADKTRHGDDLSDAQDDVEDVDGSMHQMRSTQIDGPTPVDLFNPVMFSPVVRSRPVSDLQLQNSDVLFDEDECDLCELYRCIYVA